MGHLQSIHLGFLPLIDSAPLIIACELGFATQEGLSLHLHREVSWANIRDKLNVGRIDAAHMLAPMPLASTLGIGHVKTHTIAPLTLSLNGSAITVSRQIFEGMQDIDAEAVAAGGQTAARALAGLVRATNESGGARLTFATVYPFSCHTYELRHWLAGAGINPDEDVDLVVIPPSLMGDSLAAGLIHGFTAGEPWNSLAVENTDARIVATKRELWGIAPEKVLGMRAEWCEENQEIAHQLIRCLARAGAWLDIPANRVSAAEILAKREYLDTPGEILSRALTSQLVRQRGLAAEQSRGFVIFAKEDAAIPAPLHGLWLLSQMARWGELPATTKLTEAATNVFRSDIYAAAISETIQHPSTVEAALGQYTGLSQASLPAYLRDLKVCADAALMAELAAFQSAA